VLDASFEAPEENKAFADAESTPRASCGATGSRGAVGHEMAPTQDRGRAGENRGGAGRRRAQGRKQMHRRTRMVVVALVAAALGAILGPPVVAGAATKFQDVWVGNTTASPVPTREVGEPVQVDGWVNSDGSINFNKKLYDIPAGKRLRIDYLSVQDSQITVPITAVSLTVVHDGLDHIISIPLHAQGSVADVGSEMVAAYGDPGTYVWAHANTSEAVAESSAIWFSFTGVLLDV
jgi:hypothetical protein